MNIYIINLKSSEQRKNVISRQLQDLDLSHEFIDAIDGRLLTSHELNKSTTENNYAFLPGEIGCALSHQKIYAKMIDENISEALILEDDVILNDNFKKIIESIQICNNEPHAILLSRVNSYINKALQKIDNIHSVFRIFQATTAHSYIINQKGAASLLQALYPIWMVADKWTLFEELSFLKVSAVVPNPVNLSSLSKDSTINTRKGDDSHNEKKKKIWGKLMKERTIKARLKHRFRRAIIPIFHEIVNHGKG